MADRPPHHTPSSRAFDAVMNVPEVAARVEEAIKAGRIDRPSIGRYRRGTRTPDIKTAKLLRALTGVAIEGWVDDEEKAA